MKETPAGAVLPVGTFEVNMLTCEKVREILSYDAETGELSWNVAGKGRKPKLGDVTGSLAKTGYLLVGIERKLYLAHRVAWLHYYGEIPPDQIDHINGNRADNRIANLRLATCAQNLQNMRIRSDNTSGSTGTSWNSRRSQWRAYIGLDRKQIHLGWFATQSEAAAAYAKAKSELHTFQPVTRAS